MDQQTRKPTPVALTIAGFDPSSGAGITADLQVFAAHRLFGISAITALTVQSTLGVAAIQLVSPEFLRHTLQHLTDDIQPSGVKIGMLGSAATVRVAAGFLRSLKLAGADPAQVPVVLDPVLRSSFGALLLAEDGVAALHEELLPLADWITPNLAELAILSSTKISNREEATHALHALAKRHPHLNIVATGGDSDGDPTDLWHSPEGGVQELRGCRVETTSTHGTGCAFSSALLSRLALGVPPGLAVAAAKLYVEESLCHAPGIGQGRGPMGILWPLHPGD